MKQQTTTMLERSLFCVVRKNIDLVKTEQTNVKVVRLGIIHQQHVVTVLHKYSGHLSEREMLTNNKTIAFRKHDFHHNLYD